MKIFTFNIATSYEARKLKNIVKHTLESTETRVIYFMGSGFEIKKNKKIVFILLKEIAGGYISYFANGTYCVGEFIFITKKELELINKNWDSKLVKEKIIISSWLLLRNYESIINEFENPLIKIESEILKNERDLKYLLQELENNKKELVGINKRLN